MLLEMEWSFRTADDHLPQPVATDVARNEIDEVLKRPIRFFCKE